MKERLFSPVGLRVSADGLNDDNVDDNWQRGIVKRHTGKLLGLLGGHSPQMPQIALVSDQHNNNVTVGMISELL